MHAVKKWNHAVNPRNISDSRKHYKATFTEEKQQYIQTLEINFIYFNALELL